MFTLEKVNLLSAKVVKILELNDSKFEKNTVLEDLSRLVSAPSFASFEKKFNECFQKSLSIDSFSNFTAQFLEIVEKTGANIRLRSYC